MKSIVVMGSLFFLCLGYFFLKTSRESVLSAAPARAMASAAVMSQQDPSPHGKNPGVGPIKNVTLGPIDQQMAAKGKSLFDSNCTACHGLNERKIGPALGKITQQRSPEFIMNLLVNTSQMENKDEVMKQLEARYGIKMPNLDMDKQQAREILEYLRSVAK
jgi:mono/diheme cytochrome c family protein